jgi:hypothetical protein
MTTIERSSVITLRLERQHLTSPANTKDEYEALFRLMQPVAPYFFSRPGDPPVLSHRAAFDDRIVNNTLRSERVIVKGRFQGGTVGYAYADELDLLAAAYRRDIGELNDRQRRIMELLYSSGPLTCGIIKQETGMLIKHIMPELHKLQEAFLVYEDQVDEDWERGWYVFEREWDGVDIRRYDKTEAVAELVRRFLHVCAFTSLESMRGWFRLPGRDLLAAAEALENTGRAVRVACDGEEGWALAVDLDQLTVKREPPRCVFSVHRADFLVKAEEAALKRCFAGLDVLQYVLVDGEFAGAAVGHWRQGPHDVEDIVLTLPEYEKKARKREILDAVAEFYNPPFSFIRKYDGEALALAGQDE